MNEVERLRKALEAETARCLELEKQGQQANAEMEEFVSIAAHNLREPLRELASFSQLIAETYPGRLDAEGDQFIERIRAGAAGMQSLLTAIVDYWASGDLPVTRTNMEAVCLHALLSSGQQISERSAVVTHDPLPVVMGDFDTLAKVLHHLIRNAIQYCDRNPPRVHISSRLADSDWIFSVRDNGPGIDPAFQARVFGPFKRLHGKEYPGHGLGLAYCRKAIERLDGRIWPESTPGEGSTFFFTLPAAD